MDGKQFRLGNKGGGKKSGRNFFMNAGFVALILLFGLVIYAAFNQPSQLKTIPFSEAVSDANSGQTKEIVVSGNSLVITPNGQTKPTEQSYKEDGSSIYEQGLKQGKVTIINKPASNSNSLWVGLLTGVLPVVIIAGLL